MTPEDWASQRLETLDDVIAYIESVDEDSWQVDRVRSADGTKNCFFGHLFNMGADDAHGSALWNIFEDRWATTFMIYPINDGTEPSYQQETPKQRILAYLRQLAAGEELTTCELLEAEYQFHMAEALKPVAA